MVKIWSQSLWSQILEVGVILTLGVTLVFPTEKVLAQNATPNPPKQLPIPQRPPQTPLPTPQPTPQPPLEIPPPNLPGTEGRSEIPGNITVSKFEFEGNTAFSDRELSQLIAPFTQRPITFAELLQAEAAITKHYLEKGYINSGAVILADQALPKQGAVVKIRVIEGGVEEIQVSGTKRLKPNYVRSRLKLATAKPLNQKRLLQAMQVLQLDPLIQSISADLSAGSRPELSILTVRVKEAKSFKTEFFADNNRTPSVGSFRRGLRVSEGNVLGFGDRFALEYANTTDSNAVNMSYTIPVNARNGTISLSGGFSFTNVIEKPFDVLDITGDSYSVDLSFQQPIIQTANQTFSVGVTASRQESHTTLLGEDFQLSPGADASGTTRVAALRFFQDWIKRGPKDVFAVHSQFNVGLGILDATTNPETPDSRFFDWRGQAQYVRLLAPDTLIVLRTDLQLAAGALVPLEQFALGGQQSVRGYRQDALLTDNGISASAEIRLPILRVKKVKGVLQIVPFADVGMGWNNSGNSDIKQNTLAGVGLGLQWQMGDWLTARFDWGIPLTTLDGGKKSLQEQGIYFSINYSPF
jgi:hemolysin activation/secretion protein